MEFFKKIKKRGTKRVKVIKIHFIIVNFSYTPNKLASVRHKYPTWPQLGFVEPINTTVYSDTYEPLASGIWVKGVAWVCEHSSIIKEADSGFILS